MYTVEILQKRARKLDPEVYKGQSEICPKFTLVNQSGRRTRRCMYGLTHLVIYNG